jgi:hypothetical protein
MPVAAGKEETGIVNANRNESGTTQERIAVVLRCRAAATASKYSKLLLAGVVVGAIWTDPLLSHDLYGNLADKNGQSCCNKNDCRPAHFLVSPSGIAMLVEGTWLRVPDDLVVYRVLHGDSGETSGGHWCGSIDWGQDGPGHTHYPLSVTYCAILPPSLAFVPVDGLAR